MGEGAMQLIMCPVNPSRFEICATTSLFWGMRHRRRIHTEEKAKVVVASWGTELLQLLAALL